MGEKIRAAAVAGSFYGKDAGLLKQQLEQLPLPPPEPGVHGCMVPHAGYVFSMPTALRTLARAKGAAVTRAVIVAPSHRAWFEGIAAASYDAWETPFGPMPLDREGFERLTGEAVPGIAADNAPHVQEHAIEVELPLLHFLFGAIPIVPVLVCSVNFQSSGIIGEHLARLDAPGTLWVISGDFTHYGRSFDYTPFGLPCPREKLNAQDRDAAERIANRDLPALARFLNRTHATICGISPAAVYLRMLEHSGRRVTARVTEVTDSGAVSGDYDHVVGYAGIVFSEEQP